MGKKYRIIDRFLLGLALSVDAFVDTYNTGMAAYKINNYEAWIRIKNRQSNLYNTLSALYKTGDIEKVIVKGKPYLQFTGQGKARLQRDFSLFAMQQKRWDGKWRLVIFDIEEKERQIRKILREKLKNWGFGEWQKSIYVSPYDYNQDIYEYLVDNKLLGSAFVLTVKHELMGDARHFASQIWKIPTLTVQYEKIKDKLDKAKTKKEKNIVKGEYLNVLINDPCLPGELLPDNWIGTKLQKFFSLL